MIIPNTMENKPYASWKTTTGCMMLEIQMAPSLCFLPLNERQRGWSNGSAVQELNGLRHPCGSPQQSPEYPIPSNLHAYQTCSYYTNTHEGKTVIRRAIFLLKGEESSYCLQDSGGHYTWGRKMVPPPTGHIHKREP